MKVLNINLKDELDLTSVNYEEAERSFYNNKDVYYRIQESTWLKTNLSNEDKWFPFESSDYKNSTFFIEEEEDENAIIVTRHDIVEEFFRKELGVKAKRINYARIYEVQGKKVYGVIPMAFLGEVDSLVTVHGKIRDDEVLSKMTLEEFVENVIDVREYKATYTRIGDYYNRFIESR